MKIAVIADVHCQGPHDPSQRNFVSWLDEVDADELWLLGDILHYGWVFEDEVQPIFREVIDALRQVRSRGIRILFVPGNHDFAVAELLRRELDAEVRSEHIRTVDGVRIALAHGDELDRTLQYRLFRLFIRSRLFAHFIRRMGSKFGGALLSKMAGDVSDGEDVWTNTRAGLLHRLKHAEVVVMGHVHTPWHHASDEGTAIILRPGAPLFLEGGKVLRGPLD
uniref:Uncharacterized protein conserved in bacteria n=1 Tax=uncultured delta proteobacterium HF0070_10I02 TaxID=710824 RepID=E0XS18_9DELT|nr:uncharacterized protein conserved in bacteria [uncultured delta proteobacterium HF0070_10I02]